MRPPRLDYHTELDEEGNEVDGYWYVDVDGFWITCGDLPDFALNICEVLEKWGMGCFHEGLNLRAR